MSGSNDSSHNTVGQIVTVMAGVNSTGFLTLDRAIELATPAAAASAALAVIWAMWCCSWRRA